MIRSAVAPAVDVVSGSISGTVLDPDGSAIANAVISLKGAGQTLQAITNNAGAFSFGSVAEGAYEIGVEHDGFRAARTRTAIAGGSRRLLQIRLDLASHHDEIAVDGTALRVSTDTTENSDVIQINSRMAGALPILGGDILGSFAVLVDPAAAGKGGGQLVVDGMESSDVRIPPNAIKEVRINQNPFAAEFARPGGGRIDVITTGSSSALHGSVEFLGRDFRLDARNAFASQKPSEQHRTYMGDLSGPLEQHKTASFMLSAWREEENQQAVVYAQAPSGLIQANYPTPTRSTAASAKLMRALRKSDLVSLGYQFYEKSSQGDGVGGVNTVDASASTLVRSNKFSFNQRSILSASLVNEIAVIVGRTEVDTTSARPGVPKVVVLDSITEGGAQADLRFEQQQIQIKEAVTWSHGRHMLKAGVAAPSLTREISTDRSNAQGTFYFSSLADFTAARPFSFTMQKGDPRIAFWWFQASAFLQDDIRLAPNLSVSAGLRYDRQNYIEDRDNLAPRLSMAYSPTKNRKTVLRAGFGIFYDYTGDQAVSDLLRFDGRHLMQLSIDDPGYPNPFLLGTGLASPPPNLVRFDRNLRSPYSIIFNSGIETELAKSTTIAMTYTGTRGVGLFRSINLNAPWSPLLQPPNPAIGILRQVESSGRLESNSLAVTLRTSVRRTFSGTANYTWSRTNDNAAGIGSFPADSHNLSGEWSRSDFDRRHRLYATGTFTFPRNLFRIGLVFKANTGGPVSLITGRDDNRDTFATDRPIGVPRNTLEGPGAAQVDVRWSREFSIRSARKESPTFTLGVDAFNVLNHVNDMGLVGNLSSPFFGRSLAAGWPRKLQLSGILDF